MDRSPANEIIGLFRVLSIAMVLMGGVINDRLGPKRTLVAVSILAGALLAAILQTHPENGR